MSNFENFASPQVKLVQEWGQGFQKRDLDILAKSLHKDFRQITYPRSVNQAAKTRDEFLGQLPEKLSSWTETVPTIHSIIEAPGKVIIHVRIPNFTNETKTTVGVGGAYELILIAHVVPDEDGTLKIKQIEQFVDSKTHLEHEQAFAAAKAKQE